MMLAAYFDESESQGDPPNVMTVAGYLVKATQAKRMTREIIKGHSKFGIDYFHQSECAGGGGQYAHLGEPGCIQAQDYLRAIIKRRTIMGAGVSISIDQYTSIIGKGPDNPTPYAFAMLSAMQIVKSWVDRTGFEGGISYFFENGYKDEANGKRFMDYLLQIEQARRDYRMLTWSHANKRDIPPLQAADMLAWYTNQEFSRFKRGKTERRKDFAALLRPQDHRIDHNRETLTKLRKVFDEHGGAVLL